jgi:hypothetical protein
MKVYGPYKRKDGRKHVCIIFENGKRITKSYPRYILEKHLGRELLEKETVDHINNDFTDDRIENLQILTREENIKKSSPKPKMFSFNCPICGKFSTKKFSNVKHNNINNGKSGPFCGKSCAGLVGKPGILW